jgi:hypothetical protein
MEEYKKINSEKGNKWSLYFYEKIKEYEIEERLLSYNKNINENTVNKNIEYKWNIKGLCENVSISYEYLEKIIKYERIDYSENDLYYYKENICKKSTYTIKEALKDIEMNRSFSLDSSLFSEVITKEKTNQLNQSKISLNKNIKWEDIENNKEINWDYGYLSRNPNIKLENILENMNRGWDFNAIIRNGIFHISEINKNKTLLRCKNEYYENPNFNLYKYREYIPIKSYLEINRSIHRNENINVKMIKEFNELYPEFDFDYELLGDKKGIDFDYILSENKNWNIYNLSQNPNISFNLLDNGQYKWDYKSLTLNTFDKEREKYILKLE